MTEVYVFKDWTAVSQVKNSVTPKRRAFASVNHDGAVTLTITENDSILARVAVESPDVWSLTVWEAESLLNSFGFNCRFESTYVITPAARQVLKSLQNLGAETIVRFVKPRGEVFVSAPTKGADPIKLDVYESLSYKDWLFLSPGIVHNIDHLLMRGEHSCEDHLPV